MIQEKLTFLIDKLTIDQIEELKRLIESDFNDVDIPLCHDSEIIYALVMKQILSSNTIEEETNILDRFIEQINNKY